MVVKMPDKNNEKTIVLRPDLQLVASLIAPDSKALDVGCGDGDLLHYLRLSKMVDGRGIEISQKGVNSCVLRGLSVVQGDADTDLINYPNNGFDYVILNQTLQATKRPRDVLDNLLRIGKRVIVSFPNFGYWHVRWQLLTIGKMPVTSFLSSTWYSTSNIHLCTISDFLFLVDELGGVVERAFIIKPKGKIKEVRATSYFANLLGEQAVFLLRGRNDGL